MTDLNGWELNKAYDGIHWWAAAASRTIGAIIPGLICALNVKSVIEIGIANGFTTQILARGLQANGGGKMYSCDINEFACTLCKQFISDGVEHESICSDSGTFDWKSIVEEIDLCYIDGDHSYEGCLKDVKNCLRLNPKIIIVHDYAGGQPGVVQASDELLADWNKIVIPERGDTGDYACAIFQRK